MEPSRPGGTATPRRTGEGGSPARAGRRGGDRRSPLSVRSRRGSANRSCWPVPYGSPRAPPPWTSRWRGSTLGSRSDCFPTVRVLSADPGASPSFWSPITAKRFPPGFTHAALVAWGPAWSPPGPLPARDYVALSSRSVSALPLTVGCTDGPMVEEHAPSNVHAGHVSLISPPPPPPPFFFERRRPSHCHHPPRRKPPFNRLFAWQFAGWTSGEWR